MNAHTPLEIRSALPLETRSDDNADPLATATAAVEELRTAATAFETRQAEALSAAEARIAQLETRLNRPGMEKRLAQIEAENTRLVKLMLQDGADTKTLGAITKENGQERDRLRAT